MTLIAGPGIGADAASGPDEVVAEELERSADRAQGPAVWRRQRLFSSAELALRPIRAVAAGAPWLLPKRSSWWPPRYYAGADASGSRDVPPRRDAAGPVGWVRARTRLCANTRG